MHGPSISRQHVHMTNARNSDMTRVAVFGTGYLGTTHAAGLAELGHQVLGVDVDIGKLAKLQAGEAPFYEPGLDELLKRNIGAGRLRFTSSYEEAARFASVHFVTVATPQRPGDFGAELKYVDAAFETLAPLLAVPTVIFGKSTVPVGTAARLNARVRQLAPVGDAVDVAWNPEFLREGFAVQDTLHPDRIVIGVDKDRPGRSEEAARKIYARLLEKDIPLLVTDLATSELAKASANAFLATKISFINAIAELCELTGADVSVLADAIGYDARIGRKFLNAGVGFGGGCLPKDIRALMARAGELGANQALTFLREVDSINMRRRTWMMELTRQVVGGSLIGARVAILGAAFKADSDDVRDSPALNIAGQIQLQGASVRIYDPKAMENSRAIFPTLDYATDTLEACRGADVTLVLTEWSQFRELLPADLDGVVRQRNIIDGRNCLDPRAWRAAGWNYRGIGRG
jgi:UDPglucose 6-dehydrogenase